MPITQTPFLKIDQPSAAYFKQKTNASILMDIDNSIARKYQVQATSLSFADVILSLLLLSFLCRSSI